MSPLACRSLSTLPRVPDLAHAGGLRLLKGVQRFGGAQLRDATNNLMQGVSDPTSLTVASDTASHARQAHEARLKHSKVWRSAAPVRRAVAPTSGDSEVPR